MPSSRKQRAVPRFLAAVGQKWAGKRTETRDGSSQTSIESQTRPTQLQHEPSKAGPSFSTQAESPTATLTLTPGTNSTPAVTVTPCVTLTPGVSPKPEESSTALGFLSPADSLTVAKSPGFQVLPSQNLRSPKIKHPGYVAFCPVCGKRYTHTTETWDIWRNSEQRVYIPCGHAFGSPCIKEFLDGLVIDGRDHRCPMGSCASIIHECSHITIPTLSPPLETLPVQGSQLLPTECEYCQTDKAKKTQQSLTRHHAKIRILEEKLRAMPKTNYFVRLIWRVQNKWHNWKFDRVSRKIDIRYQNYRNRRFDKITRQRLLWQQAYIWSEPGMSPDDLETIRRGLAFRPDNDLPGLPHVLVGEPQTLPLHRPEALRDITEESGSAKEDIEAIREDKGKGKAITNHPEHYSMADYIASNTWNLPPESDASPKPPAPSKIPKKVRFAGPPPEVIQAVQSPESSRRIGSLDEIPISDSPVSARNNMPAKRVNPTVKATLPVDSKSSPKRAAESFAESFAEPSAKSTSSCHADDGINVSYINRRVNIGHEVLNHEEEVGDLKIPDAKEPGSSSQ
ncbi:uncharacterized protein FTOL_07802 [Fusarium torulosum]|uniref:RING-type domain-containing protein n=1 Tax=Fusarium torulosum TaxID=33205 RepID=A0AAE8MDZ7_9HYPO|nr:uncharacterized protein FTOL_07802 [Fusarium torulosum]